MILDIEMLKSFYDSYSCRVKSAKQVLSRPMTYAEKVLYAHLFSAMGCPKSLVRVSGRWHPIAS